MRLTRKNEIRDLALSLLGVLVVTEFYLRALPTSNVTTVALSYLVVILLAATSSLAVGLLTSIVSVMLLNFYFIPPLYTFGVTDLQEGITVAAFLSTAVIASQLSSIARRRAREAEVGRDEVWRLYQLSKAFIAITDPETATSSIASQVQEVMQLPFCALYERSDSSQGWRRIAIGTFHGYDGPSSSIQTVLDEVCNSGVTRTDYDGLRRLAYAPLRTGKKFTGVLLITPGALQEGTVEAIAGLVALALERARFLKEVARTEALRQSDELKSAILASVSHDLRTPLTSIRASIDNLMESDVAWEPASIQEFHSIIREEVLRLSRLIDNLLELARLEAGEIRMTREWTDMQDFIAETLSVCSAAVRSRPVRRDVVPENMVALIDPRIVSQALVNLLENAAKYSPDGTEIAIRARLEDRQLILSVEDSGVGVAADEQQLIFEKFYRSPRSDPARSGTGMGLPVARGLIQAHNGQIWVESSPGNGSVFSFSVPVDAEEYASVVK